MDKFLNFAVSVVWAGLLLSVGFAAGSYLQHRNDTAQVKAIVAEYEAALENYDKVIEQYELRDRHYTYLKNR